MRDYDMGDFDGDGPSDAIAGPLIGGGAAQVGTLAAKLLFTGKAPAKWAGLIGAGLGGLAGAVLIMTGRRSLGVSAMITAFLVGVPRQLEDLLAPDGALSGLYGLGVISPAELAAWGAEAEAYNGLGIHVPEVLDGAYDAEFGESPVALLGETPLQLLGEGDEMGDSPLQLLGAGTGLGVIATEQIDGSAFGAATW